jgi:tripartite-type tricarboxylate transporter receptor subunit TctC
MPIATMPTRTIAVLMMLAGAGCAGAQDYPNKPIRLVTAAPGGGADFMARQLAQGIAGPLGQPVIVENRGSGIIQGDFLAKSPPDGYGFTVTGSSFWVGPLLQKYPYNVLTDFTPISLLVREVSIVAVHPSLPVKTIKELIALAKARPGELNYGSSTPGGPGFLGAELFKSLAGVNIVHVPYKGIAPAMTALLSGEVQMQITDPALVLPHAKSGRLKALAVTSAEPSALVPHLPTVAASGLPGYEAVGGIGSFAPGKTPAAIITRLNQEIVRVLTRAEVKERFLNIQTEVVASTPEQFAATLKSEIAKWSKVIKDAGIRVE